MTVRVQDLRKRFGRTTALDGLTAKGAGAPSLSKSSLPLTSHVSGSGPGAAVSQTPV